MKTNIIKRFITISVALAFTFAISAGTVHAQGGILAPVPNGADNGDGTITDGNLVWLKNVTCFGKQNWQTATNSAAGLQSGMCGLTDKSTAGQWRLPNLSELARRIENKSGFVNFQNDCYWTSTNYVHGTDAKRVYSICTYGHTYGLFKIDSLYAWPVRARQ